MKRRIPLFEEFDGVRENVPSWRTLQKPTRDPAIIESFLHEFGISKERHKYIIEPDGSVSFGPMSMSKDIEIKGESIKCFPIYLNTFGDIRIEDCPNFESLEGLPPYTTNLYLRNLPKLKSLKHCPERIGGFFWLTDCNISDLVGWPKHVRHGFVVHNLHNVKNLRGMEEYGMVISSKASGGMFMNCGFESLEGAPPEMTGSLEVKSCKLKTLKGAPRKIKGRFDVSDNQLTTLRYHPRYIWDSFVFKGNPLKPGEASKARKSIKKRW